MEFLYLLESIRNPVLDVFFSLVTHLGNETLFIAIAIAVFWCVNKRTGYYLLTVGFFGTLLNQFLKLVCRIPRPWVRDPNFTIVESARAEATGYSFPSGHTQSITGSMGCLARASKRVSTRAVCIILIALTAFSRMYLGVHTPADVCTSLLIGAVLVFALYPLFERCEKDPKVMYAVVGVLTACSLAYLLFVEFYSWPADMDPHNLESGIKNGYTLFGCGLGMLVSFFVENRYIRFEEKATWQGQVLKLVVGFAIVLGIKAGLKPVLEAFLPAMPARAVRYFIMVVFAACIWPLSFKKLSKIGTKK